MQQGERSAHPWSSPDFAVPVERLRATLILHDGDQRAVVLPRAAGSAIEQILESDEPFLAAREEASTRIYARAAIACVSVPAPAAPDEEALPHHRRAVRVHLRSGAVIEGELRYVAVEGRARVTDALNEAGPTFALHAGELVHHVAKAHVSCVEER